MPWIITFVISWIIFFFLVDWKYIKYTIWSGLLASIFQLVVDGIAINLNLYTFYDVVIRVFDSSLFFSFGAPFCIGILYAQTYPKGNMLRLINAFISTGLFFIMEYSLIYIGVLKYVHWHYLYSLLVDVEALLTLGNLITIFKLAPWMRRQEE
ncbi:MAG TPA: hypothetical protein GXX15_06205 [Clostridia bacterium]|nr:hypothetical protein [Clostridia bacterium]